MRRSRALHVPTTHENRARCRFDIATCTAIAGLALHGFDTLMAAFLVALVIIITGTM